MGRLRFVAPAVDPSLAQGGPCGGLPTLAAMELDRSTLKASIRSWYGSESPMAGPGWLQWVWTLLFSAGVGFGFFVLGLSMRLMRGGSLPSAEGLWYWFLINQVVALTIGVVIHVLFAIATRLVGQARIQRFGTGQRALFFGGVPLLGVLIGWPLGSWLVGAQGWYPFDRPVTVLASVAFSLLVCSLFYVHFDAKARQIDAEKRATEAQLRLLQGQMEPHFMFNTLGTVLSLIDVDTARARQMLEAFIDYLRNSLGKLRTSDSTLGDELDLAQAYLSLMQHRMGDRLDFAIDVADPALRQTTMPPLLIQPLVENAIQHGLECKVEGGKVQIAARREGDSLVVDVTDDGLGQCVTPVRRTGTPGNGVALKNLRERLVARYGANAALELDIRPDAGARASLRIPIEALP